jgi:hypothetical protein|tara:strand:+ start:433 stop:717 length:285 start_codon:yes stop_codon:yes gene_type:complete
MTRKVIRQIIPIAPMQYNSAYVNQLARTLDNFIDEQRSPLVNFQGIPSDGVANTLELGDVFDAGGFLKIIRTNDVYSGSVAATGQIGLVAVVIT